MRRARQPGELKEPPDLDLDRLRNLEGAGELG
jgi:hypothetical protein